MRLLSLFRFLKFCFKADSFLFLLVKLFLLLLQFPLALLKLCLQCNDLVRLIKNFVIFYIAVVFFMLLLVVQLKIIIRNI